MNNELREQIARIIVKTIKADRVGHQTEVNAADQILSLEPLKTLLEKLEQTREKCVACNGEGEFQGHDGEPGTMCNACHGEGSILHPERLVDIERILSYIRENCMQTEGCAGYLVCERDLHYMKDKEEGK